MASFPWSDEEMLMALHLRDRAGLSCQLIGERLRRSKSAVIGCLSRIDADTAQSDRSGHLNGTMPELWWRQ